MDDETLLARWAAGDRGAGDELITRHFSGVHRFVSGLAPREADELTQRTFLAVIEGASRFERRGRFRAFLFGIARNHLLRMLQEKRPDRSLEELSRTPVAQLLDSPTARLRQDERKQELLQAMQALPTEVQLTLQLHYWAELTVAEIAEITEVAVPTVRSRLTRGRQGLRSVLPATAL